MHTSRPALRFFQLPTVLAVVALLVLALGVPHAAQAGIAADFNSAWRDFHSLNKDAARSKQRHNWEQIADRFVRIYKQSPTGSYGPKSLYYVARVHEEIGNRSGLSGDFKRAVDYFQRVASRFPTHSWTDDALLRKANIELDRLNQRDAAYADLLSIVHNHRKGDMYAEARAKLRTMDAASAPAVKKKPKPRPAPVVQAKPQPTPAATRTVSSSAAAKNSDGATLVAVRHRSSDDYTRVVFDLDGEAAFKYQLLEPNEKYNRPHRLYVDLQSTRVGADVTATEAVKDGILRSIRSGQFDPKTARVVLDFADFQDYKIFSLYDPYRVVVDVYAPDNTGALQERLKVAERKEAADEKRAPAAKPEKLTPDKKSAQYSGDLIEQLGLSIETVMIDPGHGGKDPGAQGNGLLEKDVVLAFSLKLGRELQKRGFKVLFTRTDDTFVPLDERIAMANLRKADLFLSIHCNAHSNASIHGIETYSLNLARSKDAVRVAARENAISTKRISDLQVILTDLMLNSKVRESRDLAGNVQDDTVLAVSRKYKVRDRKRREAPFYVLMGAKMPAVLVELGYITNRAEAGRLNSKTYQALLAQGIADGISKYKKQIERFASR